MLFILFRLHRKLMEFIPILVGSNVGVLWSHVLEETGVPRGNHKLWMGDRGPATCRCWGSNPSCSSGKRGFYCCRGFISDWTMTVLQDQHKWEDKTFFSVFKCLASPRVIMCCSPTAKQWGLQHIITRGLEQMLTHRKRMLYCHCYIPIPSRVGSCRYRNKENQHVIISKLKLKSRHFEVRRK